MWPGCCNSKSAQPTPLTANTSLDLRTSKSKLQEREHDLGGIELRSLRQFQRDSRFALSVRFRTRWPPYGSRRAQASGAGGGGREVRFPVHPHMFRHATGFYLASKGRDIRAIQDYLGHRNIHRTVRYTDLAPGRFDDFWTD
jgi:type 1 fimbriae regulatory protein FimE